jgi:WhiB family redox-sensing transcriptional regulator
VTIQHVPVLADLLGAIAAAPNLDGAACREHPEVFTATMGKAAGRPGVYARAIAVCRGCPALAPCTLWVNGLAPSDRPYGVTAGTIRQVG